MTPIEEDNYAPVRYSQDEARKYYQSRRSAVCIIYIGSSYLNI